MEPSLVRKRWSVALQRTVSIEVKIDPTHRWIFIAAH